MISEAELIEIKPKPPKGTALADHVQSGVPIPKPARIRLFSPDEWEEFVEEWATSLEPSYAKVRRLGGADDLGIDIAGFDSDAGFQGVWDNYQCKRYDHAIWPSDIWVEMAKIIYYSYKGEFKPPRKHYFVGSLGIGTSIEKLLNNPDKLKVQLRGKWKENCQKKITTTTDVPLEGEISEYFESFDFSIFSSKSTLDLIDGHATTVYHAVRFGGGLPPRPAPDEPPSKPTPQESRYIRQLLDAYGDHLGMAFDGPETLKHHETLSKDFLRQRERFYHAEALRNFARDTVPEGTFDSLQNEIYHGVVEVSEADHSDGYERMKATVAHASTVAVTSNPLAPATKTQDRQGICHQLANDDRLLWVPVHD